MTIRASVVVPTYKRPDLLAQCLQALLAQDFAPSEYEIIIVDDAACEQTQQQILRCAEQARQYGHTVRYLPMNTPHQHGPAAARNKGWRAAVGQVIAFTDDDCLPDPGWLKAGVSHLEHSAFVGATGRIIVPLTNAPTDYEYNAAHLEHSLFVTANCFYCAETLQAVGGFDERFTAAWREDTDLFFTLRTRNALLTTAPDALVVHPIRPARWGVSLQQQRKSMFNALLYKKHPHLYRQEVQATPPWHYYGMIVALSAFLTGLLTNSRSHSRPGPRFITRVALLIWIVLTGRFCVQRLKHTSHAPGHVLEMIVTSALIPPLAIFWRLRGAIKFRVFFL